MGRQSTPLKDIPPGPAPLALSVQTLHVGVTGYDKGGVYWGAGLPVFLGSTRSGAVQLYVRAESREKAKEALLALVPHAKFLRR